MPRLLGIHLLRILELARQYSCGGTSCGGACCRLLRLLHLGRRRLLHLHLKWARVIKRRGREQEKNKSKLNYAHKGAWLSPSDEA